MNSLNLFYQYYSYLYGVIILSFVTFPLVFFLGRKIGLKNWLLANSALILTFLIEYIILFKEPGYIHTVMLGALFVAFNIYLAVSSTYKKLKIVWRVLFDIFLIILLLFSVSVVLAKILDIPFLQTIHERFPNGSYSFSPGYLQDIISNAVQKAFLIVVIKYFYQYVFEKVEQQRAQKIKRIELQKELVQAQLNALQAKVNPHFLYNSLNSIAGLALVDPEKTRQMALALSRFFRYNMNKEQQNLSSVEDEASLVKTYLEIEKIRFGDKLNYTVEISPEAAQCFIPRLLIQPLAENSVIHGLKGDIDSLIVEIKAYTEGTVLAILVKDSGAPFPDDFIAGYGIKSMYDKLDLLFPNGYTVEFMKAPEKGIKITIDTEKEQDLLNL